MAVLRVLVGLTQKEMADVLECSTATIQAIELGKLKMSDKLAGLTSLKTGINLAWLLDNDVAQQPVNTEGVAYSKKCFEEYQALSGFKNDSFGATVSTAYCRLANIGRLEALLLRAYKDAKTPLCAYKLSQFFDEMDEEFAVTNGDHRAVKSLFGKTKQELSEMEITKEVVKEVSKRYDEGNLKTSPFIEALGIESDKQNLRPQVDSKYGYKIALDGQVSNLTNETPTKSSAKSKLKKR
ncbi:MAG: hypothetical protein WCS42_08290 [Verrucomicrobiota bacterium]